MPYISANRVREIKQQIKKEFPEFKFSVRTRHNSTVVIDILEGPVNMMVTDYALQHGYDNVNHFYIKEHYEKWPEVRDILLHIYKIANEGNATQFYDSDYGAIPEFYVDLNIGDWNKPYIKR